MIYISDLVSGAVRWNTNFMGKLNGDAFTTGKYMPVRFLDLEFMELYGLYAGIPIFCSFIS